MLKCLGEFHPETPPWWSQFWNENHGWKAPSFWGLGKNGRIFTALIKQITPVSPPLLQEGAVNTHRVVLNTRSPSVVHTHTHTRRGLRVPPLAFTESSGSPNVWTHAIMFSQKNNKLISFLQATACYIIGDTALSTQTGLTRPETLLTAVYGAIKFPPLCFSFLLRTLSLFLFFFFLFPLMNPTTTFCSGHKILLPWFREALQPVLHVNTGINGAWAHI